MVRDASLGAEPTDGAGCWYVELVASGGVLLVVGLEYEPGKTQSSGRNGVVSVVDGIVCAPKS